jgi:hypothetical protein
MLSKAFISQAQGKRTTYKSYANYGNCHIVHKNVLGFNHKEHQEKLTRNTKFCKMI